MPHAMRADQVSAAFGRVLREQRDALGVSQETLALNADVDRTFVSQIERGIRQPTLTTLCKLAKALEVQPSTLVARMERLLKKE
jgi:transcriptional regulator with XRE-family HTH domain